MKKAFLYIRVSTDEQADKGYSQRLQADLLTKYCAIKGIEVVRTIFEDHSAKTFERPKWKSLMSELKRMKGKVDFLLFTKWDRFSRNVSLAYQMIDSLRSLGIETQAIEQPLDMTVPENKMILAVYLTTPEIENDRRSLNVKQGMHQARKEGRWLGVAPPGYINKIRENGEKFVDIDEPEASHMRWAFEELAKGVLNTKDVWVLAKKRGLNCCHSSFWKAIRNVGYCGLVLVTKYKDEEAYLAKGLHEALISPATFYKVQEILEKRQRKTGQGNRGITVTSPEMLPLRGFLECDRCPRILTGSATKGRNKHFYYYHCRSTCGWRQKAEIINEKFIKKLKQFIPKPEAVEVYQEIIKELYKDGAKVQLGERKKLMEELTISNDRIIKARDLLLNDTLTSEEYKSIKYEAEKKISTIEAQIVDITSNNKNCEKWDIDSTIYKAVENFKKLDLMYVNADIEGKRQIIGSIFAEKWHFQNGEHRTGKLHKAAELIYLINNGLQKKKRINLNSWGNTRNFLV